MEIPAKIISRPVGFVAVAACLLTTILSSCNNEEELVEIDPKADGQLVTVATLAELAQPVRANAPGRIVSLNDSVISSELNAKVEKVLHRRGDNITAGTVLIELDCRLYEYQQNRAKNRLDISISDRDVLLKDFARHKELREQGLISEEAFLAKKNSAERGKGNVRVARNELDIAKRDVSNCVVRAPFDATVMEVHVSVGELLQPGARMTRILDISNIEVWADLNPWYAQGLDIGSDAVFLQSGTEFALRLISKSAVPDLSSGNFKTRFQIIGNSPSLSGSGEVFWQSKESFLDQDFLRKFNNQHGVMIAENDLAKFLPIAAARSGSYIPIADIDPNTLIITKGLAKIKDGDTIKIADDNSGGDSGENSGTDNRSSQRDTQ